MTNPLNDIVPAKYRKQVYALIALAAIVFGAWQASEGNIELFIGSLIVALSHATAASNTSDPAPAEADEDVEEPVGNWE